MIASWRYALPFASRVFGYRPRVQLIGMGGRMLPNPNETMPWYREVLLTAAGPVTGLTAGFSAGMLQVVLKLTGNNPPALDYALTFGVKVVIK